MRTLKELMCLQAGFNSGGINMSDVLQFLILDFEEKEETVLNSVNDIQSHSASGKYTVRNPTKSSSWNRRLIHPMRALLESRLQSCLGAAVRLPF